MAELDRRAVLGLTACLAACPREVAARPGDAQLAYPDVPLAIDDMPAGGLRLLMLRGKPVFVRRLDAPQLARRRAEESHGQPRPNDEWVVRSGICTHAGCDLAAGLGPRGGLGCPCHGSQFDERGAVVRGPATRPLREPRHLIANGKLTLLESAGS